jgi:hypothetical protein
MSTIYLLRRNLMAKAKKVYFKNIDVKKMAAKTGIPEWGIRVRLNQPKIKREPILEKAKTFKQILSVYENGLGDFNFKFMVLEKLFKTAKTYRQLWIVCDRSTPLMDKNLRVRALNKILKKARGIKQIAGLYYISQDLDFQKKVLRKLSRFFLKK